MIDNTIITAGSTYLDIDAYACSVALAELLNLKGQKAIAYSNAPCNYSVCESLITESQLIDCLPEGYNLDDSEYIIVDVSDPDYIKDTVPLDKIVEIYDHHTGFEAYWNEKIGCKSNIEFIGAAATLIFREWKKDGLVSQMKTSTACLLIAAILDNTLNLTASNTTDEDVLAFNELCTIASIGKEWCASYFEEVQCAVEADLKNAIFNDLKVVNNCMLPQQVAQLCLWDAVHCFTKLDDIRQWFEHKGPWMLNIIDIKENCSFFICDDRFYQIKMEEVFDVKFKSGIAKTTVPYLRKEIIKKTQEIG